jgi:hypothetical protein
MPDVKRIACLANSRKPSGRCIAGIEVADQQRKGWIRPVSDRPNQAVSEYERQYEDGSDPTVLDIIDVPLLRHTPHTFQRENWLLDPEDPRRFSTRVVSCGHGGHARGARAVLRGGASAPE